MSENIKEKKRREGGRIREADICLAVCFLLLALGSFIWSAVNREDGQTLRISCDGQMIEEVSLAALRLHDQAGAARESTSETIRYCLLFYADGHAACEWYEENPDLSAILSEGSSYNLLAVDGERVWMQAADCPDQICVHHIPIKGGGESIICLPHKLAVELVGKTDAEKPDAIAGAVGTWKEAGADHVTLRKGGGHETDG